MNEEQFERELLYQATMNMFQGMLNIDLINLEQYALIDKKMQEKYRPIISSIILEMT